MNLHGSLPPLFMGSTTSTILYQHLSSNSQVEIIREVVREVKVPEPKNAELEKTIVGLQSKLKSAEELKATYESQKNKSLKELEALNREMDSIKKAITVGDTYTACLKQNETAHGNGQFWNVKVCNYHTHIPDSFTKGGLKLFAGKPI